MDQITRRTLVKRSLGTAAALSLPVMSNAAFGASKDKAGKAKKSKKLITSDSGSSTDPIRMAVIGFNGRGKTHIKEWQANKAARLVALCDADEAVLNKTADDVDKKLSKSTTQPTTGPSGSQGEAAAEKALKVARYIDFRKLLDDKNIDAVSIATPNHLHSMIAIMALQAGKDVYVEKPVSHNVWEGRQLVKAREKYNKICQAGTQSRSSTALKEAYQWLRDGNLGKINIARGLCYKHRGSIGLTQGPQSVPTSVNYDLWLGPAPKEAPRRAKFHYDWHWFWAYGNGDLGNQGIHQMDTSRWALGKDTVSPKVFSIGGRFGYKDDGQTANTQFVVHDYGDSMLIFEVRGLFDYAGSPKMSTYKGVGVKTVTECENGYLSDATAYDWNDKKIKSFSEAGEDAETSGNAGHFANFIQACHSRKQTDLHAPVLEGHISSALCHTGNISYRLGHEAKPSEILEQIKGNKGALETFRRFEEHLLDNDISIAADQATIGPVLQMDVQTERFVDNEKANAMLKREYRAPFVVPENV